MKAVTAPPPWALLLLLLLLLCGIAGCGERPPTVITGEAMGTTYRVRIEDRGIDRHQLEQVIAAELAAIEQQASTWRDDTWLSRFNASPSLMPQQPPEHVWQMLIRSDPIVKASAGAFDPTIGPVVRAWGYGPGQASGPPSLSDRMALSQQVGWDKLELDHQAKTLRKLHPQLELDFSAIGKGYAVDRLAALLDAAGCEHYLIEFGGEVFGRCPSAAEAWDIGIQRPDALPGRHGKPITLSNQAAATSGTYYQDRAEDQSSHLIDPRTGQPVPPAARSVTVVMPTCAEADAWATALMVLGPEQGDALLNKRTDLAVYWATD